MSEKLQTLWGPLYHHIFVNSAPNVYSDPRGYMWLVHTVRRVWSLKQDVQYIHYGLCRILMRITQFDSSYILSQDTTSFNRYI